MWSRTNWRERTLLLVGGPTHGSRPSPAMHEFLNVYITPIVQGGIFGIPR